MTNPVRYTYGVGTTDARKTLGDFPLPNPVDRAVAFYDFNQYVAADWTVTNTTSHATIALVAASSSVAAGGVLKMVGGASSVSTDVAAIQATPLNFYFPTTAEVWFYAHLKVDVALNNAIIFGIASSIATGAPTDGIYFSKAAASANVDFVVRGASASSTLSAVTVLADATDIRLGFYYNGKDSVLCFANDIVVGRQSTLTNLPSATALAPGLSMVLAATAPTTAYASTDFILAAQTRSY